MHFLSVLTDRVCRPSTAVRVAPLYQMCGRVASLHVAFPHHIAKVCKFWKDFCVRTQFKRALFSMNEGASSHGFVPVVTDELVG